MRAMLPSGRSLQRLAAYWIAFSTIGLAHWLRATFGNVTVDQALWHVRFVDRAALQMSTVLMVEFSVEVLALPCAAALLAASAHGMATPRLTTWKRALLRTIPIAAWAGAVLALLLQFSVFSYAAARFEPDRFGEHYVDPRQVELKPGKPRNLILIYVESLEQTYGDADLFGRDLLAPLRRLGGYSYPSYRQVPGATWTIAGMVATQCGVPLKVYSERDVDRVRDGKVFLPGATCLGDVLQAHGYLNVFLGAAPLSFAGKGAFLRDHGYAERWGREEWKRYPEDVRDRNAWGLYDHKLLEHARKRLAELHAAGQPFNLTILTLDTHNPQGLLSPFCRERGVTEFTGIVTCSAEQVASLVEFARVEGYLKDTVVVIVGDHLAVPNSVWERLEQAGESRRIFNLVLAADAPAPNTRELVPFDLFPTLLELVGIDVVGDRLGLGYSAVGEVEVARPANRAGVLATTAWQRASPAYDRLWAPPRD